MSDNSGNASGAGFDEIPGVLAQLRHAYSQLASGSVKDQKRFAEGLIAPQIRRLERHTEFPITSQL